MPPHSTSHLVTPDRACAPHEHPRLLHAGTAAAPQSQRADHLRLVGGTSACSTCPQDEKNHDTRQHKTTRHHDTRQHLGPALARREIGRHSLLVHSLLVHLLLVHWLLVHSFLVHSLQVHSLQVHSLLVHSFALTFVASRCGTCTRTYRHPQISSPPHLGGQQLRRLPALLRGSPMLTLLPPTRVLSTKGARAHTGIAMSQHTLQCLRLRRA